MNWSRGTCTAQKRERARQQKHYAGVQTVSTEPIQASGVRTTPTGNVSQKTPTCLIQNLRSIKHSSNTGPLSPCPTPYIVHFRLQLLDGGAVIGALAMEEGLRHSSQAPADGVNLVQPLPALGNLGAGHPQTAYRREGMERKEGVVIKSTTQSESKSNLPEEKASSEMRRGELTSSIIKG